MYLMYRGKEFWEEAAEESRRDMWRLAWQWMLLLAALVAIFGFFLWRSQSAVEFAVSRVEGSTPARYRVHGVVRSAATGKPVAWPVVADDPVGKPPHFRTNGNFDGSYELWTLAEPHDVRIAAEGFRSTVRRVGQVWYLWLPSGELKMDVALDPE